ncbi:MAG TPA: ribosomal protein S18-alanine N-acetyltransferase [Terriglobales bacterium]|nr:ribosomal protein S18-alanine N-acetyltransferase [Terriglobales bacterium]
MIIRPAFSDDIDSLLVLEQSCDTAAHWSRAEYERLLTKREPHHIAMVAEREERAVAFIVARDTKGDWEIENLVVDKALRRKGIGSALLWTMVEHARGDGMRHMFLEVRESNVAARKLYESAGFHQAGRRRAYYQNPPEDALILECSAPGAARESR